MARPTLAYDHDYNLPEIETPVLASGERPNTEQTSSIDPKACDLTFVVPIKDERATLHKLCEGIEKNVPAGLRHEVLLIDDGSSDGSWEAIAELAAAKGASVRGIRFRSNCGKAAALAVGFREARGDIVFTMDGDLQDDPQEIRRFLKKLEEGYDLVSGWKQVRHDPWHKVLPSRVFNRMLSWFSGVPLHDHNCGFKCYRSELAKSLPMRGEWHRMTPSLAGILGFRVAEIPVKHHPRRHGASKYGVERFLRGFSDMLTMGFLRKYRERPSHLTNTAAVLYLLIAVALVLASPVIGSLSAIFALVFLGFSAASVIAGLLMESALSQTQQSAGFDAVIETVGATLATEQQ